MVAHFLVAFKNVAMNHPELLRVLIESVTLNLLGDLRGNHIASILGIAKCKYFSQLLTEVLKIAKQNIKNIC
jgi:hypothetical protein